MTPAKWLARIACGCGALALGLCGLLSTARADALERLRLERLAAVHEQVARWAQERQPVAWNPGFSYEDVRAVLHVHSAWSHDSRAPVEEIVAAAKQLKIRVVMFTEHIGSHFDYYSDGHRGEREQVLLIPGAETGGLLAFPTRSLRGESSTPPQPYVDLARADGGLVFLSHLEERLDWKLENLTGAEIYNTHADVKDELRFQNLLKSPLGLLNLATALRRYPQETFAAIQDYPEEYLRWYDERTQHARLCGIAANDAHHNQVLKLLVTEERGVRLEDALGKELFQLPAGNAAVAALLVGKEAGESIVELDLDPYERSLRHVSTHLWLPEQEISEATVREALRESRAYVAFDWMADPTGFYFVADDGANHWIAGSELTFTRNLRLRAATPLAAEFRLLAKGEVVARETGREFNWTVSEPGVYRLEVWQTLAGEPQPWILSNPIYIRAVKSQE